MIALALSFACTREPAEAPASGDPSAAVSNYFTAMRAHDCAALEATVAESAAAALAEHGCAHAFATFEQHATQLEQIESVRADGRDASLRLVHARLHETGRSKTVVIGVRWVDGRWRVVRI